MECLTYEEVIKTTTGYIVESSDDYSIVVFEDRVVKYFKGYKNVCRVITLEIAEKEDIIKLMSYTNKQFKSNNKINHNDGNNVFKNK